MRSICCFRSKLATERALKFSQHIVSCRLERVACVNLCLTAVDINVPVITCHASKQSSKMAMEGDYEPARLSALMCQRLIARNTYVIIMIMLMMIVHNQH